MKGGLNTGHMTELNIMILYVVLNMQLIAFSAEPSGPWDGGDDIILSISFAHMASLLVKISVNHLLLTINNSLYVAHYRFCCL